MSNKTFFNVSTVESGCFEPIYNTFQTLLLKKGWKQQNLADAISVNKSYVSRIVHGIEIPPLRLRLIIASKLGTDSALIWRRENLEYIKKQIKRQDVTDG